MPYYTSSLGTTTTVIKQGDTARSIGYTLQVGSSSVDLTNATISLSIQQPNGTLLARSVDTVSPPTSGSVMYKLVAEDTAVAGLQKLEFRITFVDGTILRLPNSDYLNLNVVKKL